MEVALVAPDDTAVTEVNDPRVIGIAGTGRRRPKPTVWRIREPIRVDSRVYSSIMHNGEHFAAIRHPPIHGPAQARSVHRCHKFLRVASAYYRAIATAATGRAWAATVGVGVAVVPGEGVIHVVQAGAIVHLDLPHQAGDIIQGTGPFIVASP